MKVGVIASMECLLKESLAKAKVPLTSDRFFLLTETREGLTCSLCLYLVSIHVHEMSLFLIKLCQHAVFQGGVHPD